MAKLTVILTERISPSLNGFLKRWCIEIKSGVLISTLTKRVRDELWNDILENIKDGAVSMIYPAYNQQRYEIRQAGRPSRIARDFEGITLTMIPPTVGPLRKRKQNEENILHKNEEIEGDSILLENGDFQEELVQIQMKSNGGDENDLILHGNEDGVDKVQLKNKEEIGLKNEVTVNSITNIVQNKNQDGNLTENIERNNSAETINNKHSDPNENLDSLQNGNPAARFGSKTNDKVDNKLEKFIPKSHKVEKIEKETSMKKTKKSSQKYYKKTKTKQEIAFENVIEGKMSIHGIMLDNKLEYDLTSFPTQDELYKIDKFVPQNKQNTTKDNIFSYDEQTIGRTDDSWMENCLFDFSDNTGEKRYKPTEEEYSYPYIEGNMEDEKKGSAENHQDLTSLGEPKSAGYVNSIGDLDSVETLSFIPSKEKISQKDIPVDDLLIQNRCCEKSVENNAKNLENEPFQEKITEIKMKDILKEATLNDFQIEYPIFASIYQYPHTAYTELPKPLISIEYVFSYKDNRINPSFSFESKYNGIQTIPYKIPLDIIIFSTKLFYFLKNKKNKGEGLGINKITAVDIAATSYSAKIPEGFLNIMTTANLIVNNEANQPKLIIRQIINPERKKIMSPILITLSKENLENADTLIFFENNRIIETMKKIIKNFQLNVKLPEKQVDFKEIKEEYRKIENEIAIKMGISRNDTKYEYYGTYYSLFKGKSNSIEINIDHIGQWSAINTLELLLIYLADRQ